MPNMFYSILLRCDLHERTVTYTDNFQWDELQVANPNNFGRRDITSCKKNFGVDKMEPSA